MAYHLHARSQAFELHYFARSHARDRVAFLRELLASEFARQVVLHLDDEAVAGDAPVRRVLDAAPRDAHLYTCGPAGFLQYVLAVAAELDWPAAQVHYEMLFAARARGGRRVRRPY